MSDAYGPSGGQMLRRAFLWTIGAGAAAYAVPKYFDRFGFGDDAVPGPSSPAARLADADAAAGSDAPATETFRAREGNQFFVTGSVDGNPVHFIVDTGATDVSLTQDDARMLGFDLSTLDWSVMTHTANGDAANAAVTLADLRLGRIVEYNVPALVMRSGGMSLLGMSFLSRLKSWQISDGVLTIAS